MKLHSPEFENTLRIGIEDALRRAPELCENNGGKETSAGWRQFRTRLNRLFAVIFPVLLVTVFARETREIDAALEALTLWTIAMVCGYASALVRMPWQSSDIVALRLLPAEESDIFRWEWDKLLFLHLFLAADLAGGFIAMGVVLDFTALQWLGALVVLPIATAYFLALAALGAARWPAFPYSGIAGGLFGFPFLGGFVAQVWLHLPVLHFITQAAPVVNVLSPTGWPLMLMHLFAGEHSWAALAALVPVAVVLSTWKNSARIIAARFEHVEPIAEPAPDLLPTEDEDGAIASPFPDREFNAAVGVTEIEEGLLSGRFLARPEWARGRLARLLWSWFDAREKTMAEFAFPNGLDLTRPWKTVARNFLITAILGVAATFVGPGPAMIFFGIGLFIVYIHVINLFSMTGSLFQEVANGGVTIPLHAVYPMSYRGLSRFVLKCSAVQWPFITLLLLATALALTPLTHWPPGTSIIAALGISVLLWGARLYLLVFAFSGCTNDTARLSFRSAGLMALFLFFGLSFLLLCAFALCSVLAGQLEKAVGAIGPLMVLWSLPALLNAYLFFRIYGWYYNHCRFDAMRVPK